MTDLVKLLRDEDSYYRLQEKHWCIDAEELERQRLAAADSIEALEAQIDRLASFIMHCIEGEPSQNQGAVDTAIRIMTEQATTIGEQLAENERLREALGLADAALSGANMNMNVVERKVRAALGEKQ